MGQSAETLVGRFQTAKSLRTADEADWKLCAAYCLPTHYNGWNVDGQQGMLFNNSSATVRRMIYDSTGTRSLPKYMAILERLATPNGMRWAKLRASEPKLMAVRRVKEYFDQLSDRLHQYRTAPRANFRAASNEVYAQLGAYGNGPIFVGRRNPNALSRTPGIIYRALRLADVYWLLNDQGEVDTVFRRYYLNYRQFKQQFPSAPVPPCMSVEAGKATPDESKKFEFIQVVYPRTDDEYDPQALDARRHPMCSVQICVTDKMFVGEETGFQKPPILTPRTFTMAEHGYGLGPAGQVLAAMGGASQIKKVNLKQGNMAGDPVILSADDGALNGTVDLRPGHVNPGGISRDGKRLIDILPTGNWQINEALLQDERSDIEDGFFVTLFQILTETPEMTATEVMERVAEKAALLSPTMGRMQTEFLGPNIEREIDVLDEIGALRDLEMPPELIEARGQYETVYTSPMAKGEYAEETAGFTRLVDLTTGVVSATQDPEPFDLIDFDKALPEIADNWSVPVRWMSDPDAVAAKRQQRGQAQQQDALMKNAPALASAAKTASQMGSNQAGKAVAAVQGQ